MSCLVPVCLLFSAADALARDVVDVTAGLIGRPYVWGADGPDAFDCSGLMQYVFQKFGVELPRRAVSQSRVGIPSGRRLRRGDLLFFSTDTRRKTVTHVGLYEGDNIMINATKRYGAVRREDLTDSYWVDRFMFARRIDSDIGGDVVSVRRGGGTADPPRRSNDKRRTAIRVLGGVAGILIERSRGR